MTIKSRARFALVGVALAVLSCIGDRPTPTIDPISPVRVRAQERVDLATPITVTTSSWQIEHLLLYPRRGMIVVRVIGDDGREIREKTYDAGTNPTGATLISQLNQANLSTRSLYFRVMDRLITDGVISGTTAGTPR